jgi:hypothetical protein
MEGMEQHEGAPNSTQDVNSEFMDLQETDGLEQVPEEQPGEEVQYESIGKGTGGGENESEESEDFEDTIIECVVGPEPGSTTPYFHATLNFKGWLYSLEVRTEDGLDIEEKELLMVTEKDFCVSSLPWIIQDPYE